MRKVRIGIIGSGSIARDVHMPAYAALDNAEITAVADINVNNAKTAAQIFGVKKVFQNYKELLSLDEIDAVDICTPNSFHKPIALAALRAGKHVLVEKPVAVTAAETQVMVAAAERAHKILMVGLNCRMRPETRLIKRAIKEGALGEIYYAEASFTRRRGIPGWGVFTDKKLSGGGPLLDLGVHVLDWAMYLMDFPEPDYVSGLTYAKIGPRPHQAETAGYWAWDPQRFEVEDLAVALIRFKNGACLYLKSSWAANIPKDEFSVMLVGSEGGCSTNPLQIYREEYGCLVDISPVELPATSGHNEVVRRFVEAVLSGSPAPIPAESTLVTSKIIDGIYRSAERGREVKIRT